MKFNQHSDLEGKHAFLSPSKYHWLRYSDDKLRQTYLNHLAVERGTQLHDLARQMTQLGIKAQKSKSTFNAFVNDSIGYHMSPETGLIYSNNCFGTADAISFNERDKLLRIHDLKTGVTPASMEQLLIYAALFCLEYDKDPEKMKSELRIYQNNDVLVMVPDPEEIRNIMQEIIHKDEVLENVRNSSFE